MPQDPRSSPPLAPHVQAAIGQGLQTKAAPRAAGGLAPHVQRAVQATLQAKPAPATRAVAPHLQAALSRAAVQRPAPAARPAPPVQRKARFPADRSIQPCSALIHTLTCGLFGSPAPVNNNNDAVALLEQGVSSSSSVTSNVVKKKSRPMVALGEGVGKMVPYGSAALNLGTTTCGLVIVHTEGSEAVGYHWRFCQDSEENRSNFQQIVGSHQGTSIEVVVNGGRYRTGDTAPAQFGAFLHKTYGLPVTVYRQVLDNSDSRSDVDPWVNVDKGGISPPIDGYALVAV